MTDGASQPPRKRRPRYRGTHPRAFSEKYKELDPTRFPNEREKVLASGKTPAGSHVPVLVLEVLAALGPKAGDLAVDATLGFGGHASELLKRILPGGRLLGLDVDPIELPRAEARLKALARERGEPDAVRCVRRNYAGLRKLLAEDARGALLQLALPLRDLVGMNVELLGQLGQRFLTLHCGQGHLGLERRCVVPARTPAHLLSSSQPS